MKRMKQVAVAVGVIIVALVVLGVVVLPPIVRPVVEKVAETKGVDLEIGGLRVGVLRGAVGLSDVQVGNPPGFETPRLAAVDSVSVNAKLIPLLGGDLVVQSIAVKRPELNVERIASGEINLAAFISQVTGGGAAEPEPGTPEEGGGVPPFRVNRVTVRDMIVSWTDRSLKGASAELVLEDMDVTVRDLYTPMPAGSQETTVDVTGRIGGEDQGSFRAKGKGNFLGEKLDFTMTITLDEIALTAVQAYAGTSPVTPTGGTVSGTIEATCTQNALEAVAKMHVAGLTLQANKSKNVAMQLPAGLLSTIGNVDPDHDVEVRASGDLLDPNFHLVSAVLMAAVSDIMDLGSGAVDAVSGLATSAGAAGAGALDKAGAAGEGVAQKTGEALGGLADKLPFGRK